LQRRDQKISDMLSRRRCLGVSTLVVFSSHIRLTSSRGALKDPNQGVRHFFREADRAAELGASHPVILKKGGSIGVITSQYVALKLAKQPFKAPFWVSKEDIPTTSRGPDEEEDKPPVRSQNTASDQGLQGVLPVGRLTGKVVRVKCFRKRPFGFLTDKNNVEHYWGSTSITASIKPIKTLKVGETVEFEIVEIDGKKQAGNVTAPGGGPVEGADKYRRGKGSNSNVVKPGSRCFEVTDKTDKRQKHQGKIQKYYNWEQLYGYPLPAARDASNKDFDDTEISKKLSEHGALSGWSTRHWITQQDLNTLKLLREANVTVTLDALPIKVNGIDYWNDAQLTKPMFLTMHYDALVERPICVMHDKYRSNFGNLTKGPAGWVCTPDTVCHTKCATHSMLSPMSDMIKNEEGKWVCTEEKPCGRWKEPAASPLDEMLRSLMGPENKVFKTEEEMAGRKKLNLNAKMKLMR